MNLKDSKIIVTGGSSGIGREIAKLLISKGAKVLITGRDKHKLTTVANEIGAIALHFDISELDQIPGKAKDAIEMLGGVDALINNAGIGAFSKLGEISMDDMQRVYTTNVFGLTLLTQEVAEVFKKQNYGNIINIGSTASLKGFAAGSVYAASKFAVRGMTQCWQAELRPFNIRVSLVNPSEVASAFAKEDREERAEKDNKLGGEDIAHSISAMLEMRDKGFIPELTVWATNPF